MPIINNPFNGKLNLDVSDYRITNGDFIDALNITRDAEGSAQDRVVSNILGNENIAYTLPAGTNKVIGFYPDKIRNRGYYFIWNSNNFHSILYYNMDTNTVVKVLQSKTDSDGVDILSFNPSYKVLSVNIFYRDDEGDILFFNDGLNPPRNINVTASYGTSWKLEYLLVSKAPPIMPAKVVYENDTAVTINNLRNSLFQFSYRYVYDNNEKSVWSSNSIVPLPQQPTLNLTEDSIYNNSRISVSFSTGGADVKAIELAFRQTTNGVTSDWFLISSYNKASLSILDNDIYNVKFYNDSIYISLSVTETSLLQDWVPQKANAAELANGNVLLYSGITEGYDKTKMQLASSATTLSNGFYFDNCGVLFFAVCDGLDSGSSSNTIKIYLYGTGTNVSGNVFQLNNGAGTYCVNAYANSGFDLSVSYTSSVANPTVSSILSGISTAFQANSFVEVSLVNNVLTMSYVGGINLTSSGVKYSTASLDNTVFANAWESGYQYGVQYFDAQGRTIGTQSTPAASFNTPANPGTGIKFPQTKVAISNRPPIEAKYYQITRSNNTTYNKRLFWISNGAYSSVPVEGEDTYAYIDVSNIEEYNKKISSTQSVVSYTFAPGDRIRFLKRYNSDNIGTSLFSKDYEVIGTETVIDYKIYPPVPLAPDSNEYTKTGNFIKIKYPSNDISSDFQFSGTADFQHYEIFLYNFISNASETQRFFYESGKCFGIANAGTSNAYHLGLDQNQSANLVTPAIVSMSNGDLFYRKRNVPYSDNYELKVNSFSIGTSTTRTVTWGITLANTISNSSYVLQTEPNVDASLVFGSYPQYTDTNCLFRNLSATESKLLNIKGKFSMSSDGTSTFSSYAIIVTSTAKTIVSLLPTVVNNIIQNTPTEFDIDKKFTVPANAKVWLSSTSTNDGIGSNNIIVNSFDIEFNIVKDHEIEIIEPSFNDTYNLITNSNGRASIIDENAKKVYFPTLIRFGGAYQSNTNVNDINRFYFENFDEYDRSFGDVMRLHVRDRYLKVYQKFKVGNVPILTQIVKDVTGNPLQANTDQLINKIQYYAGDYGIGDASTSLAWNNFADYFVDDYRGVVCRLAQDGITPISIVNTMNSFFVSKLKAYRDSLNNGVGSSGNSSDYYGDPCIYGSFDAYTNKYVIAMEEINRYTIVPTTTTTTSTTTLAPLNFSLGYTCNTIAFGETPTANVTASTFSGGSGVYDINPTLYVSEASALSGTFVALSTSTKVYINQVNSTYWVAIRDRYNLGTKKAVQVVVNCPEATTTTTTTTSTTTTSTTTTTTAGPTTTTTTTAPPPLNRRYNATRCSDSAPVVIIISGSPAVGSVWTTAVSGISECLTVGSFIDETTSAVNTTLYTQILDCSNPDCQQPSTTTSTTTSPPPLNRRYNAVYCSNGGSITIVIGGTPTVGSVWTTAPTGTSECLTVGSFVGLTADPINTTLYSEVLDCSVPECVQPVGPTTTSTTTSTTTEAPTTTSTTTPAPPEFQWYTADAYLCDPCTSASFSIYVRSSTSLTVGMYYNIADGYVYQLSGLTTSQPTFTNFDGVIAKSGFDCDNVCQL